MLDSNRILLKYITIFLNNFTRTSCLYIEFSVKKLKFPVLKNPNYIDTNNKSTKYSYSSIISDLKITNESLCLYFDFLVVTKNLLTILDQQSCRAVQVVSSKII